MTTPPEAHVPPASHEASAPKAPIETMATTTTDRSSLVVRPGVFLTLVIASAFGAGAVIYWLLRTMHI